MHRTLSSLPKDVYKARKRDAARLAADRFLCLTPAGKDFVWKDPVVAVRTAVLPFFQDYQTSGLDSSSDRLP